MATTTAAHAYSGFRDTLRGTTYRILNLHLDDFLRLEGQDADIFLTQIATNAYADGPSVFYAFPSFADFESWAEKTHPYCVCQVIHDVLHTQRGYLRLFFDCERKLPVVFHDEEDAPSPCTIAMADFKEDLRRIVLGINEFFQKCEFSTRHVLDCDENNESSAAPTHIDVIVDESCRYDVFSMRLKMSAHVVLPFVRCADAETFRALTVHVNKSVDCVDASVCRVPTSLMRLLGYDKWYGCDAASFLDGRPERFFRTRKRVYPPLCGRYELCTGENKDDIASSSVNAHHVFAIPPDNESIYVRYTLSVPRPMFIASRKRAHGCSSPPHPHRQMRDSRDTEKLRSLIPEEYHGALTQSSSKNCIIGVAVSRCPNHQRHCLHLPRTLVHHNSNAFFVLSTNGQVFYHCRSSKCGSKNPSNIGNILL